MSRAFHKKCGMNAAVKVGELTLMDCRKCSRKWVLPERLTKRIIGHLEGEFRLEFAED